MSETLYTHQLNGRKLMFKIKLTLIGAQFSCIYYVITLPLHTSPTFRAKFVSSNWLTFSKKGGFDVVYAFILTFVIRHPLQYIQQTQYNDNYRFESAVRLRCFSNRLSVVSDPLPERKVNSAGDDIKSDRRKMK